MTTANHSTNQPPHGLGNLGQIIKGQEQFTNTREHAEEILDGLKDAEKRNGAQEVELKTASTTAQMATAELSAIARELAEVKNNGATPKVIKSAAKKTAVKKPINQELAV